MKTYLFTLIILICSNHYAQELNSGDYNGLLLAYDSNNQMITGYYEDHTGWDENTQSPKFSCIFYLEGKVIGSKAEINTYHPGYRFYFPNKGTIEINSDTSIVLNFHDPDAANCSNVRSFEKASRFILNKKSSNKQIRYISKEKAYFHAKTNDNSRLRAYVIQGDIVYVEKTTNEWAYCSYSGKKVTKGWIKLADLNFLEDDALTLPTPDSTFFKNNPLNSETSIENYIKTYFSGGDNMRVLETTSWDTDGKPRDCHTTVDYDRVTIENYSCEIFPMSSFIFRGYPKEEVLRILKLIFNDTEYDHWKNDEYMPIEEGVGCYLSIEVQPFKTIVFYGCGC